ncbi:hypothetical protein V8E53_004607 [Lactarius tabidus]
MRSSPSHLPVPLPPLGRRNHCLRRRESSQDLRWQAKVRPPRRVESTKPCDTSSGLSSGEETAGEYKAGEHSSDPQQLCASASALGESTDNEDEAHWIDEDAGGIEGVADDLLQLEFHMDYVGNVEKRQQRWKLRCRDWEALLRATDTTLMLLAALSNTGKLHSVASRAVRCDSSLHESTDMLSIRSAFAELSDAHEEDLRRALDTAIGSLHALGSLYERREMRWIEEKYKLDEDKKVQLLLKQVLGFGGVGNLVDTAL